MNLFLPKCNDQNFSSQQFCPNSNIATNNGSTCSVLLLSTAGFLPARRKLRFQTTRNDPGVFKAMLSILNHCELFSDNLIGMLKDDSSLGTDFEVRLRTI